MATDRIKGCCFNPLHCGAVVASSGTPLGVRRASTCFNPLHCGAVVASGPGPERRQAQPGFNPLHCGAVVASPERRQAQPGLGGGVSIPFIAGQWSLRAASSATCSPRACFNPLHCGAVVASRGSGVTIQSAYPRFNPLHCGAVVASINARLRALITEFVSIPFIAGQWSLPGPTEVAGMIDAVFQSPSLRGSGRF